MGMCRLPGGREVNLQAIGYGHNRVGKLAVVSTQVTPDLIAGVVGGGVEFGFFGYKCAPVLLEHFAGSLLFGV
jgi:hypothetical protein